jgi:diguanylate cyclase (GGDEF)-like protein
MTNIALENIKSETKANILNSLETVNKAVQKSHKALIKQRSIALHNIPTLPDVITIIEQLLALHNSQNITLASASLTRLREKLAPMLAMYNDQGFFVIAPDQISIASGRDVNTGTLNIISKQRPELVQRAFSGETVFIPTIKSDVPLANTPNISATIFIMAPVYSKLNEIIAVFALRINTQTYFSNITQLGRIGASGETYAFNQQGYLLTESRFDQELISNKQMSAEQRSTLNIRVAVPSNHPLNSKVTLTAQPLTAMAKDATSGNNGSNLDGYLDYRGIEVFGVWRWNANLNFGYATEIDVDEALRPYFLARETLINVLTGTTLLAIMMSFLIIRIQTSNQKKIIQTNLSLEHKVTVRTKELVDAKTALTQAVTSLEILAVTDSLTGLANRRKFDQQLNEEWQRCLRQDSQISILIFDIDYFKLYNDHYGHVQGDRCIREIAQIFRHSTIAKRPGDIVARYGGEEFVVLLSDADQQYTEYVAKSILTCVQELAIEHKYTEVVNTDIVTVSVGYTIEANIVNSNYEKIINQADSALYQAKHKGRNQIMPYNNQTS